MYNLTDYSLSDLRIIQAVIEDRIAELEAFITLSEKHLAGDLRDSLVLKYGRAITVLKEHNVHLLTAIAMVKQNETVNSN